MNKNPFYVSEISLTVQKNGIIWKIRKTISVETMRMYLCTALLLHFDYINYIFEYTKKQF